MSKLPTAKEFLKSPQAKSIRERLAQVSFLEMDAECLRVYASLVADELAARIKASGHINFSVFENKEIDSITSQLKQEIQ